LLRSVFPVCMHFLPEISMIGGTHFHERSQVPEKAAAVLLLCGDAARDALQLHRHAVDL
jgi:hypothetical protein